MPWDFCFLLCNYVLRLHAFAAQGGFGAGMPQQMHILQAAGGLQGLQPVPGYQGPNMGNAPGMYPYGGPQQMQMAQQYQKAQAPAPDMNGSFF